jgi:putative zinc finger/helix-turn-helix YgiT family protein
MTNRPPAHLHRRRCFECGELLRAEYKTVPYPESGLDNVSLANVPVWACVNGHEELEIPAVDELHDLLADIIIRKPTPLVGAEVRFLRKRLELTAREFAGRLGITSVHLSRLENGRRGLQRSMDLLVRLYCAHTLSVQHQRPCPPELISVLQQLEALQTIDAEHRVRHRRRTGRNPSPEWVEADAR